MSKRGRVCIRLSKIPEKSIRYVRDLWNTLVNMSWMWLILVIAMVNLAAYIVFALLFFLDAWISGDFDNIPEHKTCIIGIHNFTSFFMLGIETITTTGYGYFHPTEFCYLVFVILTGSTMVTIFIDGAFISVVYAKFGKPTFESSIFSKKAVVNLRNGKLCLIIRINDSFRQHWIENKINMYLIKGEVSKEGEVLTNFISELNVKPHGMIFWPIEIVHEITSTSPLWEISAKDLTKNKFEIIVIITGSSIQTGQLSRTQTSYLNEEILWGYRFIPCLEYNADKMEYIVNRKLFNEVVPSDIPSSSAKMLTNIEDIKIRRNSFDGIFSSDKEVT